MCRSRYIVLSDWVFKVLGLFLWANFWVGPLQLGVGIRYCERGSTSTADFLGAYLLKTGAQKVYYQVAYLLKTSGLAVH